MAALLANAARRVLSEPCEVVWAGFRSNTYALQQAGWEIAAEEDFVEGRIRLMLRHQDMNLYAMSEHRNFNFFQAAREYVRPPVFHVINAAPRIEVMRTMLSEPSFKQIDAMPQYATRVDSIEDMGIFATPLARTEEIIVEPADVYALLEQIRTMQAPEQAEIRKRERRRDEGTRIEAVARQQFHAQILSFDREAA